MAKAAADAGADEIIDQLPAGYEQLLGRWFADGAELSVGEWQRIALARAFLRRAPILILDEPTSAMDPWAEADWLGRFRRLAGGRTVIMITHRFTTARLADQIHVMSEGRIIESGTHEQLAGDEWAIRRRLLLNVTAAVHLRPPGPEPRTSLLTCCPAYAGTASFCSLFAGFRQ